LAARIDDEVRAFRRRCERWCGKALIDTADEVSGGRFVHGVGRIRQRSRIGIRMWPYQCAKASTRTDIDTEFDRVERLLLILPACKVAGDARSLSERARGKALLNDALRDRLAEVADSETGGVGGRVQTELRVRFRKRTAFFDSASSRLDHRISAERDNTRQNAAGRLCNTATNRFGCRSGYAVADVLNVFVGVEETICGIVCAYGTSKTASQECRNARYLSGATGERAARRFSQPRFL